jgi:hypothetical protein
MMGLLGGGTRTAARLSPWARAIAIGEVALVLKRHLDRLDPGEPTELRKLLVKSRGRPSNLTKGERSRVMALVRKLEPGQFAKDAAVRAAPLRRKR